MSSPTIGAPTAVPIAPDAGSLTHLAEVFGPMEMEVWVQRPGSSAIVTTVATEVATYVAYVATGDATRLDRAVAEQRNGGRAVPRRLCYYAPILGPAFDRWGEPVAPAGMAAAAVDWFARRLAEVAPDRRRRRGAVVRLYLSRPGTGSGLHWDGRPGTLAQLIGSKEGWILPPDHAAAVAAAAPGDPNSTHDPFALAPDPRAGHVTLTPGRAVVIPEGWWHAFRAVAGPSASLATWWPGAGPAG